MRVGVALLVLWTAVNVVMSVRIVSRMDDRQVSRDMLERPTDGRTPILVPWEAREAVLTEMRLMLGSVQGVIDGIARGDTAAIRTAAAASGLVNAADPALATMLPPPFLQYGMAAHRGFDDLARSAGARPGAAIADLAAITSTCVACHAAYRLEVE